MCSGMEAHPKDLSPLHISKIVETNNSWLFHLYPKIKATFPIAVSA